MPTIHVRLRCRHCHLTLSESELAGGPCPECLEAQGVRRADFARIEVPSAASARARCERCGILIEVA